MKYFHFRDVILYYVQRNYGLILLFRSFFWSNFEIQTVIMIMKKLYRFFTNALKIFIVGPQFL